MEIQLRNTNNIIKKNKREFTEDDNQQKILEQVISLIQTLNKMRFVQKISRPIDKRIKEEYVQKFAGKMEMLHHKLQKVQKQCAQKMQVDAGNQNNNMKTKQSIHGSNTMKITDWRKGIRTIQTRYVEVFEQGSFKHYKRLMLLNNFPYKLDTINIHEWASNCLSLSQPEKSCCCC